MPPPVPEHFKVAKRRMRQGLHPAVLAAAQRALKASSSGAPSPGAGSQVYLGTGVNTQARAPVTGDARSALAARTGQQFQRYVQRDPEGGIREVHVYGHGDDRRVAAFTRKAPLSPSVMQQLSNTATAEDKLLAIAARRAAAEGKGLPKRRVFNYRGGGLSRNV